MVSGRSGGVRNGAGVPEWQMWCGRWLAQDTREEHLVAHDLTRIRINCAAPPVPMNRSCMHQGGRSSRLRVRQFKCKMRNALDRAQKLLGGSIAPLARGGVIVKARADGGRLAFALDIARPEDWAGARAQYCGADAVPRPRSRLGFGSDALRQTDVDSLHGSGLVCG